MYTMAVLMQSCDLRKQGEKEENGHQDQARFSNGGTASTYTCNRWPMSCIRLAARCLYISSWSASMPALRLGELASCSAVKYHLESSFLLVVPLALPLPEAIEGVFGGASKVLQRIGRLLLSHTLSLSLALSLFFAHF